MRRLLLSSFITLMVTPGASVAQSDSISRVEQDTRSRAEQGDAQAQSQLAFWYYIGDGRLQNYAEALYWYRLAAEQGRARAQFALGEMYRLGHGVQQDYYEAAHWYRSAAEQGEVDAQNNLGHMYRVGNGVPQDYVTAHMWLNIAAVNAIERSRNEPAGISRQMPFEELAKLARRHRDPVASHMAYEEVNKAQQRAQVCMESNYQDCD